MAGGSDSRFRATHTPLLEQSSNTEIVQLDTIFLVVMAEGPYPIPSRTRKSSPPAPMVLQGPPCGRVGHRQIYGADTGRCPPHSFGFFNRWRPYGDFPSPGGAPAGASYPGRSHTQAPARGRHGRRQGDEVLRTSICPRRLCRPWGAALVSTRGSIT